MSTSSLPAAGASRQGSAARSGSSNSTGTLIVTIAGVVALLLVVFLATMVFGNVLGTEFCPYTFDRRGYAFREIPFTGIQISSIDRRTDTGIVELHILQKGYIVPDTTKTTPKDWHLLSLIRFRGTYAEGDAELLMKYLDATDDKGNYAWLEWSEENPQLAKILWPAVAKTAQAGNYLIVPDLFSEARSTKNPAQLQTKLDAMLAKVVKPIVAKPPAEKGASEKKASDEKPAMKS